MSRFSDALMTDVSDLQFLPLLHSCKAIVFRDILESNRLKLQPCEILNEELIYTFYGVPSYRSKHKQYSQDLANFLVAIILDTNKINDKIYRSFPFDSGAFCLKKMENFFDEYNTLEDFDLKNNSYDGAKMVVKTFYDNNENYLKNIPVIKEFLPSQFEANSYMNLISRRNTGDLDDRASSIEILYNNYIELTAETVHQIILPLKLADDPGIMSSISSNYNISNPLTYDTFRNSPSECIGSIRTEYNKFIKSHS